MNEYMARILAGRVAEDLTSGSVLRLWGEHAGSARHYDAAHETLADLCVAMGYEPPVKRQQEAAA